MCGFNGKTLLNTLANPLDPPNPTNPFGSNISLAGNSLNTPLGKATDLGGLDSGNQVNISQSGPTDPNNPAKPAGASTTSGTGLGAQITDALNAELTALPQEYSAFQKYSPLYSGIGVSTLGQSLFGPNWTGNLSDLNNQLTQQSATQTAQSNTALRQANLNDINSFGGQSLAQMKALNPELYAALASQSNAAGQGLNPVSLGSVNAPGSNSTLDALAGRALGPMDPLLSQQNQIASSQLALGGQLTPDQLRAVQQSSRAGYAARGLDGTNASVVNEALQTQGAQNAMLQQRLANAGAITSQNQQANEISNSLGLGVSGQQYNYGNLGLQGQLANAGLTAQQAQLNAGIQGQAFSQGQSALGNYAGTAFNPFVSILGQSSQNVGTNANLFGDASSTANPALANVSGLINPFNSYAQDYFNTQANANYAQQIASQNSKAGITAGAIGAAGSLGGAVASNWGTIGPALAACCWVARSVYGIENPRWRLFRFWLLTTAPDWFRNLYLRRGEAFAAWLDRRAIFKRPIRLWMDSRIRSLKSTNAPLCECVPFRHAL